MKFQTTSTFALAALALSSSSAAAPTPVSNQAPDSPKPDVTGSPQLPSSPSLPASPSRRKVSDCRRPSVSNNKKRQQPNPLGPMLASLTSLGPLSPEMVNEITSILGIVGPSANQLQSVLSRGADPAAILSEVIALIKGIVLDPSQLLRLANLQQQLSKTTRRDVNNFQPALDISEHYAKGASTLSSGLGLVNNDGSAIRPETSSFAASQHYNGNSNDATMQTDGQGVTTDDFPNPYSLLGDPSDEFSNGYPSEAFPPGVQMPGFPVIAGNSFGESFPTLNHGSVVGTDSNVGEELDPFWAPVASIPNALPTNQLPNIAGLAPSLSGYANALPFPSSQLPNVRGQLGGLTGNPLLQGAVSEVSGNPDSGGIPAYLPDALAVGLQQNRPSFPGIESNTFAALKGQLSQSQGALFEADASATPTTSPQESSLPPGTVAPTAPTTGDIPPLFMAAIPDSSQSTAESKPTALKGPKGKLYLESSYSMDFSSSQTSITQAGTPSGATTVATSSGTLATEGVSTVI